MGSEILDSSGGARSVAPGIVLDALPGPAVPLLEFDELPHVLLEPPPPAPSGWARTRSALGRLVRDRDRRRTAARTVLVCGLLMLLTASLVEYRSATQASAERSGRVALDIRLDDVRPLSSGYGLSDGSAQGLAAARVELHNLGPEAIELVGLDVTQGGTIDLANDVTGGAPSVGPGRSSDTTYELRLPCRASQQKGIGTPELTARIRTVDGVVHPMPVNLTGVNVNGGMLTACISDAQPSPEAVSAYSSTSDADSVVMTIVVGGDAPKRVSLITPNVGVPVEYLTVPRLPAVAQAGVSFVVRVTPRVERCSRTPLNLDALPGIGLRIGTEVVSDTYLPALVAQAAGRACGTVRR